MNKCELCNETGSNITVLTDTGVAHLTCFSKSNLLIGCENCLNANYVANLAGNTCGTCVHCDNFLQVDHKNEAHQGWVNWDTWNISLWLNGDEGMYSMCLESKNVAEFEENGRECVEFMTDNPNPDKANWQEIYDNFFEK